MIFFDIIITLWIFIITGLGAAAFLNIAFTGEGSGTVAKNSKAGGAILARRVFAITIIVSTFLFAVPILFLLGVYSDWFARVSLSWGLSIAVTWCAAVLPLLIGRLAFARFLLSIFFTSSARFSSPNSSRRTMRMVGLTSWLLSFIAVGALWWVLVFSTAGSTNLWNTASSSPSSDDFDDIIIDPSAPSTTAAAAKKGTTRGLDQVENSNNNNNNNNNAVLLDSSAVKLSSASTTSSPKKTEEDSSLNQNQYYQMMSQNKHTPFSCRFTGNDVHVLKRSGILAGGDVADGTLGSKSSSMSSSFSKSNQERMLGKIVASKKKKKQMPSDDSSSSASSSNSENNNNNNLKQQQQANNNNEEEQKLSPSKSHRDNQNQHPPIMILTNREILVDLQQNACSGFRDSFLARMALAGAVCVAALSGFAAISTPVDNLFPYLKRNSERDAHQALTRLQRRLKNVMKRWGSVSQEGARVSWQLRELMMSNNNNSNNAAVGTNNLHHGGTTPPPRPPLPPPPLPKHLSSSTADAQQGTSNNNNNNGWFSKAKSFISNVVSFQGGDTKSAAAKSREIIEKRLEEVNFEIAGYRYLTNNLLQTIESTSATLEVASMGKSRIGKLRAIFGICLSLFGAAKTINLAISVFWRKLSGEDAATAALRNFVTMFSLQGVFDVAGLASKISLVLNMFLVLGSLRGFLLLMFRLTQSKKSPTSHHQHHQSSSEQQQHNLQSNNNSDSKNEIIDESSSSPTLINKNEQRSSWWFSALLLGGPQVDFCPGTLSLVSFSLFMGLHFLGAFVLLRLGFPAKSRGIIIDAVGTVPFVPCHSVHDVSFLVSVVMTGIVLRITRVTLADEDDDADDENCYGVDEMMRSDDV